ncbi:valine--tRNA ligase [Aliiroseovarius sp.]|uniref:valine--tRNA ligase n=1 Tax=Aliiroseovarius sp. TaxID=1872442 RepID=UPI00262284C1|nr:valine--tRNA ligase [Aliiroseovarius sp.]
MAMEKTFDAQAREGEIYAAWEVSGAFRAGANASRDESFCVMIPPPNVTGALHVGHAFNNTLQDILVRWHRMRGFDTLWQPGQDHAGIATQLQVEKMLAATQQPGRRELGRDAFLQKVWEWKGEYGGTIVNQLKRLGSSCDWERNAFTMSGAPGAPAADAKGNFHDAVIKVFVEMYNKGLIYKGKRLVNWDPHFETAISDLEVEQIEVNGKMWRLRYPLEGGQTYTHITKDEDGNEIARETRDYLVVATTRPETMLGDTGVAVHPDDERYQHLIGKTVKLPLCGRSIPIVADDYADPEKGTGAVKITPAHDFNDRDVGKRTGLRIINVMGTRAQMFLKDNADFAEGCDPEMLADTVVRFHDMDRYEARDAIVTEAHDNGWLDGIDEDRHMVPHGDRSKVAIEPFLTDQWYVDTAKIVGPALDAVRKGRTKIIPESGEKTYYHWLANIEPWCISRQLWWGHQVPVWYDEDGKEYCAATEAEAVEMAGGKALTRDEDVLDTWFSSGLWPIGTLGWPADTDEMQKYFSTDVLITGFDILFFWVARMMMMQLAVVDEIPFHTVYLHQLVRDEKGKKMSKTTGNVIDPLEIIDEYGADALRFTNASMAAIGGVLKLSEERIKGYRNFGTKLWNAARFAEMNDCKPSADFDPAAVTQTVNKWIVGETAKARIMVDEALDGYRFNEAANGLYAYVWGKVCDWYLEFAKPLLNSDDAAVVAETRATMAWVIDQCLVLLHPIMPFITEQLWGDISERQKMLVHADWPTYGAELVDEAASAELNWVIQVIDNIRSARAQVHVPAGLKIPVILQEMDAAGRAAWAGNEALIKRMARIDSLTERAELPKGCITVPVDGGAFALPLADIIDVDAEKARLEKTLGKLAKELGGLRGRLNNPKFVASAPDEVVEEARANLAAREAEEAKINEALSRLADL